MRTRAAADCRVSYGDVRIVIYPPAFDLLAGVLEGYELMDVQALAARVQLLQLPIQLHQRFSHDRANGTQRTSRATRDSSWDIPSRFESAPRIRQFLCFNSCARLGATAPR